MNGLQRRTMKFGFLEWQSYECAKIFPRGNVSRSKRPGTGYRNQKPTDTQKEMWKIHKTTEKDLAFSKEHDWNEVVVLIKDI